MGAYIPTERIVLPAAEQLGCAKRRAAAARTQRVCAWCGAVEPAAEGSGSATTHGLCRTCLEKQIAGNEVADTEPPPEADDRRDPCD